MISNIDDEFRKEGYVYIVGIDEAGRGPLAGPVVACAVVLPPKNTNPLIDDSKKLSKKLREQLVNEIKKESLAVAVATIDAPEIDAINIYQASKKAMEIALSNINIDYDIVLTDAMPLDTTAKVEPLVKGDARSLSIAAASIVAKVYRDELMDELDKKYPNYGFKSHKGYATKKHLAALRTYGPIKGVHRYSYKPVSNANFEQLKLF
jgi:ribonuclease HII